MMKYYLLYITLFSIVSTSAQNPQRTARVNEDAPTTHYKNGKWVYLNDEDVYEIQLEDKYSKSGIFTDKRPQQIDTVIDLKGRFVYAPFGNAHTHSLSDGYTGKNSKKQYLKKGVFYAANLTAPYTTGNRLCDKYSKPQTVDVLMSHGGITTYKKGRQHPATVMNQAYSYMLSEEEKKKEWPLEGNAYWFMNSMEKIETQWDSLINQNPDVVKIYLMRSGENLVDTNGNCGYGLCPETATEIVRRSHAAGKRVFAHVNTAEDVRVAVKAGVDVLAHLPLGNDGIAYDESEPYILSDSLIKEMAAAQVAITPTAALLMKDLKSFRKDTLQREVQLQKSQLQKLDKHGVKILLGTDGWNEDVTLAARYYDYHQIFPTEKILWLWSYQTPRGMFPDRKIGELRDGFEASFIVYDQNLINTGIEELPEPQLVVKQGEVITFNEPQ